ncbi:MAG: branched-chain amino acid ABC transporter permease, partial [Pseudomonadota bacterium]
DILYDWFYFMPDGMSDVFVWVTNLFVGKQWHLTSGLIFMLVVIFLPGGLVEAGQRIARRLGFGKTAAKEKPDGKTTPAE